MTEFKPDPKQLEKPFVMSFAQAAEAILNPVPPTMAINCWTPQAATIPHTEWKHRCSHKPRTEIGDLGSKLAAQILLADTLSGIVIPSDEEWIGVNLLERDDELPPRRRG